MDLGLFIFALCLLVPGIWLILRFSHDIKERVWLNYEWRIERERKAAMLGRRRSSSRSIPRVDRSPVETTQPVTETAELPLAHSSRPILNNAPPDPWQSMTALDVGEAFRSFLRETSHPCDGITASQVSDAFEKFLGQGQPSTSV